MLNNKKILITGGTGSFGKEFVKAIFKKYPKVKKWRLLLQKSYLLAIEETQTEIKLKLRKNNKKLFQNFYLNLF